MVELDAKVCYIGAILRELSGFGWSANSRYWNWPDDWVYFSASGGWFRDIVFHGDSGIVWVDDDENHDETLDFCDDKQVREVLFRMVKLASTSSRLYKYGHYY